jgi:curved DNA-binding protein
LSDAEKRKQYDTFGSQGFKQRYSQEDIYQNSDISDILRDMGLGGDFFSRIFGGQAGARGGGGGFKTYTYTGGARPGQRAGGFNGMGRAGALAGSTSRRPPKGARIWSMNCR